MGCLLLGETAAVSLKWAWMPIHSFFLSLKPVLFSLVMQPLRSCACSSKLLPTPVQARNPKFSRVSKEGMKAGGALSGRGRRKRKGEGRRVS